MIVIQTKYPKVISLVIVCILFLISVIYLSINHFIKQVIVEEKGVIYENVLNSKDHISRRYNYQGTPAPKAGSPAAVTATPERPTYRIDVSRVPNVAVEPLSYYQTILSKCGLLCDTSVKQTSGTPFNQREVVIDCDSLFQETLLPSKGHGLQTAPRHIPSDLLQGYTLDGAIPTKALWYFNQTYHGGKAKTSVWSLETVETMKGNCLNGQLGGAYGGRETQALLDGLRHAPKLKGGRVLVIGSESPWVEACVLAAGATSVVTLEYGKINSQHPAITTVTPGVFKQRYFANSLGVFDSIVTFSSLEHSGLGRYGDALNPWADVIEIARARCVTSPGGSLVFGVPYGSDAVVWNNKRVYGTLRLPYLTTNWKYHYLGRGSQRVHVLTNK